MSISFEIVNVSSRHNRKNDYTVLIYKIFFPKDASLEKLNEFLIFFNTLVDADVRKIIINMNKVEYIDSSSIGMLINITKIIRKNNGNLIISEVSSSIKETFDVINLKDFIDILNNDIDAINHFRYI